jgi:hypothetical protein
VFGEHEIEEEEEEEGEEAFLEGIGTFCEPFHISRVSQISDSGAGSQNL